MNFHGQVAKSRFPQTLRLEKLGTQCNRRLEEPDRRTAGL
jgi:hypothetical protein